MSNTLESLKEYLTPELIGEAAQAYSENEIGIYKAISSLGPTILAGLLEKSGDSHSIDFLFNSLRNFDPAILNKIGSLIDSENLAQHDPKDVSGQLLGTIFGAKVPAITNAVAAFSGVKQSTVSSLLGLAGPLMMGLLSKKIKEEGLNAFSLVSYLLSQRNTIISLLPAGVGSLLGMAGIDGIKNAGNPKPGRGMGCIWLFLLFIGLGVALGFYVKW